MCGIAGFLHFDKDRVADKAVVKRMADTIIHRGPDGEGYYCNKNLALGHRRLSIIDLSTGDQPMFEDDQRLAIIFNGEIYNYIELREELKGYGHSFRTDSDTEVILKAYKQWGVEFQNKLNGMWAIALWDDRKQQLLLSRDRLGEKALAYAIFDNTIIFGSEMKAVFSYGVPDKPALEMSELYFTLGYVPAPFSFFKQIQKLQAGHYLIVCNGSVKSGVYWDLPKIDESNMRSDRQAVQNKFEELLQDSIRIRMRSDVPFGAFLSGGLDSSAIVALMSKISSEPVKTFTIGFKEKMFDESKLAKQVAEKFQTNHLEQFLEPGDLDQSLRKVMKHFDEPFGDSSAIPTGNVSAIAAKKVKMVLTGDGGDEVLSGYTGYQGEKFAYQYQRIPALLRSVPPLAFKGIASVASGNIRYKLNRIVKVLSSSALPYQERLMTKFWCTPLQVKKLINQSVPQISIADYINDFYSKYPIQNSFYRLMYFQFKILLPDDFLTKVDRMSMAHSLETRIPFLDYRLVEFMIGVDMNVKMEGYERKSILRNTIGRRLPSDILKAPKRGFVLPLREWFKDRSFESKLQSLYQSNYGLNQKIIKDIVTDNTEGRQDAGNFLWMILLYKSWAEKH